MTTTGSALTIVPEDNAPQRQHQCEEHPGSNNSNSHYPLQHPFLTIQGTPVYFQQDWATGIGGGLWSTGLAMARYFDTKHAADSVRQLAARNDSKKQHKRGLLKALELGSGNGLLSVCFMALAGKYLESLVVTDVDDHLDMIRQTVRANGHILSADGDESTTTQRRRQQPRVHVMEHKWGEALYPCSSSTVVGPGDNNNNNDIHTDCRLLEPIAAPSSNNSTQTGLSSPLCNFDFIFGTDVAYREHLYEPLTRSILAFSHAQTVSLVGVTMNDTTPTFFGGLDRAGLAYEKLSDHLLDDEFRGSTFAIFVLQKKQGLAIP
jgi:hypothetical protein